MRVRLAALALPAALLLLSAPARADCPPIRVILSGTVVKKNEDRPVSNFPITIRIRSGDAGLSKLNWEAVVTDADGRFRWSQDFPADPCLQGNLFKRIPLKIWGWLRSPMNRSYRHHARALPEEIVLNLGQRLRRIDRDELLDHLGGKKHVTEIDLLLEI